MSDDGDASTASSAEDASNDSTTSMSNGGDVGDDALGALLATVTDAGTPFALTTPAEVSANVVYALEPGVAPDGGALWSCSGERAYSTVATRWWGAGEGNGKCLQVIVWCWRAHKALRATS